MRYLCVIEKGKAQDGRVYYGGYALDLSSNVASKPSRDETIESLRRGIALTLLYLTERGLPIPQALTQEKDVQKESPKDELIWLEPTPINPVSLEIEALIRQAGLTQAEVARRLGTSRAAVNRLCDPFYWGHSLSTLRRLAEVLQAQVEVKFSKAVA